MEEMIYEQIVILKESDFDGNRMTFYAIFSYFQTLATSHAEKLGFGFQAMYDKGLYWVLVKNRCDILAMPKVNQKVRMVTWPLENARVDCGREFIFLDEEGNTLIKGISRWALINHQTFRLYPAKNVIFPGTFLKTTYMNSPFDLIPFEVENELGKLKIVPEDIDGNQHTNNTKYVLFAENFEPKLKNYTRFQIDFANQSFLDDELTIYQGKHCVYGLKGEQIIFKVNYGDTDCK